MSFGGEKVAIRAYREQAGLLQVDLAKKLDVDQAAVSNWERGVNRPQSKYIRKMCTPILFICTKFVELQFYVLQNRKS